MENKRPSQAVHEDRVCPECKKHFITNNKKQIYCSRLCYHRKYGRKNSCRRRSDINREAIDKIIRILDDAGYEYVSGYENQKSTIQIRCKVCGTIKNYCADSVRNIGTKYSKPKCETCLEVERRERIKRQREENEAAKGREKFIKSCKPIEYDVLKFCPRCGQPFQSKCDGDICSKCKQRLRDRRREKRVPKELRNQNLTWRTLWNNGERKCALCGGECDPNDYTVREDGTIIVGNLYPSLDHIVPVFAGGGDSLDNVQLAHYRCNTLRGVEDWKRHRQKLA